MQANHNRKCSGLYSAAILAEPAQSSFIVRVDIDHSQIPNPISVQLVRPSFMLLYQNSYCIGFCFLGSRIEFQHGGENRVYEKCFTNKKQEKNKSNNVKSLATPIAICDQQMSSTGQV